jgi:hypothetical protein
MFSTDLISASNVSSSNAKNHERNEVEDKIFNFRLNDDLTVFRKLDVIHGRERVCHQPFRFPLVSLGITDVDFLLLRELCVAGRGTFKGLVWGIGSRGGTEVEGCPA